MYRFGYAALRQGALLGLIGIALTSAVLGASLQIVEQPIVYDCLTIASFGGLVALLVATRPFGQSECIQAFSNPFDGHDLAQHSRSYASTRYFRQVKDSDFAQGEAALVAFNLYRVVWVMMGFVTAKLVILDLVMPNFAELQGAGRPLDWGLWALVAGGAILGILESHAVLLSRSPVPSRAISIAL